MFSKDFMVAIKLAPVQQYILAQRAGISPDLLSKWLNGIRKPSPDDPRLLRLAKNLGFSPDLIFVKEQKLEGIE